LISQFNTCNCLLSDDTIIRASSKSANRLINQSTDRWAIVH
jgi:hypothetical protein